MKKNILIGVTIVLALSAGLYYYLFHAISIEELKTRVPEIEKAQFMDHGDDIRNTRYGEILTVFNRGAKVYVEVYNTMNSNELPHDLWMNLDADELKLELDATQIIMNGPRYWVINDIDADGETKNGKVTNFGGIEMTKRASLEGTIFSPMFKQEDSYLEKSVERDTEYTYYAGNEVYELVSPDGARYRMQSYTTVYDDSLTIDNLANLGQKLNLPDGWKFEVHTLEQDEIMNSGNAATIINDEFANTYQKIS